MQGQPITTSSFLSLHASAARHSGKSAVLDPASCSTLIQNDGGIRILPDRHPFRVVTWRSRQRRRIAAERNDVGGGEGMEDQPTYGKGPAENSFPGELRIGHNVPWADTAYGPRRPQSVVHLPTGRRRFDPVSALCAPPFARRVFVGESAALPRWRGSSTRSNGEMNALPSRSGDRTRGVQCA